MKTPDLRTNPKWVAPDQRFHLAGRLLALHQIDDSDEGDDYWVILHVAQQAAVAGPDAARAWLEGWWYVRGASGWRTRVNILAVLDSHQEV
jgi:hypothetical protein